MSLRTWVMTMTTCLRILSDFLLFLSCLNSTTSNCANQPYPEPTSDFLRKETFLSTKKYANMLMRILPLMA